MAAYKHKWSVVGVVQRDDPVQLEEMLGRGDLFGQDDLARGLMAAAEKCFEQCARLLLKAGALPDIHDSSGITPLIAACKQNQAPMVRLLIDAGCKINKTMFRIRATALHWSASLGHVECARLLVEAGAKIEPVTVHGRTPLQMACRSDQEAIVTLLLNHGASVTTADHDKSTPLHLACEEGATDCVRLLIKHGADVNSRARNGDTPIMLAAKKGHIDALKLLLRQIPLDLNLRGHQMSALHWAAEGGHLGCSEALVKYGSDPNVMTKDCHVGGLFVVNSQVTPLMLACRGGYSLVSQMLLKSGAEPDATDIEGMSALLYAVKKDSAACVKVLAEFGAELNGAMDSQDDKQRGLSPLILSVRKNKLAALGELLRNGVDTDIVCSTKDGELLTAFEFAISLLRVGCCKMLIISGHTLQVVNRRILEQSMAELCDMDEEVFMELCNMLWSARSLKDLCRIQIRKSLGRKVGTNWEVLPLPTMMKSYISLDELGAFTFQ